MEPVPDVFPHGDARVEVPQRPVLVIPLTSQLASRMQHLGLAEPVPNFPQYANAPVEIPQRPVPVIPPPSQLASGVQHLRNVEPVRDLVPDGDAFVEWFSILREKAMQVKSYGNQPSPRPIPHAP